MLVDCSRQHNKINPIILLQNINGFEGLFSLKIPDDLIYFENHFPGQPMLPGVVQTQWVLKLANQLTLADSFFDNFSAMTKLKFMRPMIPGDQLNLQLKASTTNKSLHFRFFDEKGDYSSGQLSFT